MRSLTDRLVNPNGFDGNGPVPEQVRAAAKRLGQLRVKFLTKDDPLTQPEVREVLDAAVLQAEWMRELFEARNTFRDGLAFYADEENWRSRVLYEVPAGEPNEGAQTCESGPAWDGGKHARRVLGREARRGRKMTSRWSDFDWALFLLDGAEQSLVDEFHAQADPRVMNFLAEHQERRDQLRREYATNERVRQEYQ